MYDVGARVFSNSWGSADYGRYTVQSRAVDAFMRNNPDALGTIPSLRLSDQMTLFKFSLPLEMMETVVLQLWALLPQTRTASVLVQV